MPKEMHHRRPLVVSGHQSVLGCLGWTTTVSFLEKTVLADPAIPILHLASTIGIGVPVLWVSLAKFSIIVHKPQECFKLCDIGWLADFSDSPNFG